MRLIANMHVAHKPFQNANGALPLDGIMQVRRSLNISVSSYTMSFIHLNLSILVERVMASVS